MDPRLSDALDHHMFDLGDRFGWIEPLWTDLRAVHDRVATIQFERVFEIIETLTGRFIAAID